MSRQWPSPIAPLRNAPGIHEPYVNRLIVELVGDDGVSGFGEAAFSSNCTSSCQPSASTSSAVMPPTPVNRCRLSPTPFGRIAGDRDPVYANFVGAVGHGPNADSARVQSHRSGCARSNRTFPWSAGQRSPGWRGPRPRSLRRLSLLQARWRRWGGRRSSRGHLRRGTDARTGSFGRPRQMMDRYGFKSVKLKGGVFPPADRSRRDQGACAPRSVPTCPLRIDPNCAWTVETSVRSARAG